MRFVQNYINGKFVDTENTIEDINPATGDIIAHIPKSSSNEVLEIYKKYKVSEIIKMSSSLKFCVLAAGEADIYAAKARAWEWDIAAGHAILEHAGGFITTHDEKKFLYG